MPPAVAPKSIPPPIRTSVTRYLVLESSKIEATDAQHIWLLCWAPAAVVRIRAQETLHPNGGAKAPNIPFGRLRKPGRTERQVPFDR